LLAAAGSQLAAIEATDEALQLLGRVVAWPYEEARTLLIRGRIERRAKRRAAARSSLERALAIFGELEAQPWARQAVEELERLGRRGRPELLSDTEAHVASLAARGLTNRQVAELAFITPKSVEGVLARVYGKLGISSRAQLGAWAASTNGRTGSDESV
jgi:DNA-binding CsgD family transcriptional regulator